MKSIFSPSFVLFVAICIGLIAGESSSALAQSKDYWDAERRKMVELYVSGAGITNEAVLKAIGSVPRHEFVPVKIRDQAYYDAGLPIGDKQTISSPFIVAYMTESLDPQPNDRVLEIGTGSGYQAAVLSPIVKSVYSIEIVAPLGKRAAKTLKKLKYKNVYTKIGDGFKGWKEKAPFDKIIVTCSPERIPQPLVDQLREGGMMVVPVGERYQQTLFLLKKVKGKMESVALRPTLFVPMTGAAERLRKVKPDPLNPKLANGDFEEEVPKDGFIPGWYYQRQLDWKKDKLSPSGNYYVSFTNKEDGRAAHVMQGFPVGGKAVIGLKLSASYKHENIFVGATKFDLPRIALTFYDDQRRDLGTAMIGPFRGDSEGWLNESKDVRVPLKAKEAILRIGLFGGTGTVAFDNIRIKPVKAKKRK